MALQELNGFKVGDTVEVILTGYGSGQKGRTAVITELCPNCYSREPAARTDNLKNPGSSFKDWIALKSFKVITPAKSLTELVDELDIKIQAMEARNK